MPLPENSASGNLHIPGLGAVGGGGGGGGGAGGSPLLLIAAMGTAAATGFSWSSSASLSGTGTLCTNRGWSKPASFLPVKSLLLAATLMQSGGGNKKRETHIFQYSSTSSPGATCASTASILAATLVAPGGTCVKEAAISLPATNAAREGLSTPEEAREESCSGLRERRRARRQDDCRDSGWSEEIMDFYFMAKLPAVFSNLLQKLQEHAVYCTCTVH